MNTAKDYQLLLTQLLPTGLAINLDNESGLQNLLFGFAKELARVDSRSLDLFHEAMPTRARETFSEWLNDFGVPGPCKIQDDLRAQLIQKIGAISGQNPAFYKELGKSLGFSSEPVEFSELSVNSYCNDFLFDKSWQNSFSMMTSGESTRAKCGLATAGDFLLEFEALLFKCILSHAKPAHTGLPVVAPGGLHFRLGGPDNKLSGPPYI